jgi:hypothetical protein
MSDINKDIESIRFLHTKMIAGETVGANMMQLIGQAGRVVGELERLRAIVDRLPVTADGVPVAPGMTIYEPASKYGAPVEPFVANAVYAFTDAPLHNIYRECYSTREAAEAAAKEKR